MQRGSAGVAGKKRWLFVVWSFNWKDLPFASIRFWSMGLSFSADLASPSPGAGGQGVARHVAVDRHPAASQPQLLTKSVLGSAL